MNDMQWLGEANTALNKIESLLAQGSPTSMLIAVQERLLSLAIRANDMIKVSIETHTLIHHQEETKLHPPLSESGLDLEKKDSFSNEKVENRRFELRSMIPLGDYYLYMREVFNNDAALLREVELSLSEMQDYNHAFNYFRDCIYLDMNEPVVQSLLSVVEGFYQD